MDFEKLQKLQQQVRIGGKGTPRRKVRIVHKTSATDDKKLTAAIKKLNVQAIPGIEEVNMFKQDGKVIHFKDAKVQASIGSCVFVISGKGQDKELTELVPGILNQMGPESLETLRKFAAAYQQNGSGHSSTTAHGQPGNVHGPSCDDDVPDLVENFDEIVD